MRYDGKGKVKIYNRPSLRDVARGGTGVDTPSKLIDAFGMVPIAEKGAKDGVATTDDRNILTETQLPLIYRPFIISPVDGSSVGTTTPTITASGYGHIYETLKRHREWQMDVEAGNFTTPIQTYKGSEDNWLVGTALIFGMVVQVRCRDVDIDNHTSEWSIPVKFTIA